jgi:cyclopropane fatty-acyl-phospholipid synthase-like methyltransferase
MVGNEEDVIRYYEHFWSKSEVWWETDTTLAIHYGYYDKGIHSHTEAVLRMNDVSWELLKLNTQNPLHILDAGCGVGGTSIHLAQKYKNITFTGITIVPTHVAMAEKFSKKRNVSENTRFLLQNYCHTSFQDNSFDGVIALESANYAHANEEFIKEVYRVLKPGGRVSILDGFCTEKPIPKHLKNLYKTWLEGRALLGLEPINEFAACMKQQGFKEVVVKDISSNVISSYFLGVLIGGIFFFPALLKTFIRKKNQDTTEDFDCFMASSIAGGLLALYGCFKYYAVTATK